MNKSITTFTLALAFVTMAALAPLAQAVEMTSTSTSTATTTVATTSVATTTVATTTASTTPVVNSTIAGLLAQLAKLTTLFNELKAKLMGTQAEIKELRADIREGMTDADIKTIQELLASDPAIYPKGLVTGYFGPMTKEAIMKFQAKNGLEVTGEINAETRAALDIIIAERRAQGKFPVGLLMAPGLKMKFEDKFKKRCEGISASTTAGMICLKVKNKHKMDDDEDEDDDSNKPATLQDATRQIDDAMKAAADLRKKLDKKEYVSTTSASTLAAVKVDLVEGEKDIADAKKARTDGDYAKAIMLADRAEETLDDAKDVLEGEDEDDNNEDEDEDEDEDDN